MLHLRMYEIKQYLALCRHDFYLSQIKFSFTVCIKRHNFIIMNVGGQGTLTRSGITDAIGRDRYIY